MSSHSSTLGEHVETQKGFAFKSAWFFDSGRPIVKVKDFTSNSVDVSNLSHVSEEIAEKHLRYQLHTGDVVIQTVGSWPSNPASVVGKCVRIPRTANNALLNQNAVRLKPLEQLDGSYLYYSLKNPDFGDYIVGTAQGAASQAAITLDAIRSYRFPLPDLPTQRRIAGILSAYDDLIENNLRRIKILEEMAQSLYREWFVHFRIPSEVLLAASEASGEGRQKAGLPPEITLVDSPLGPIPEGWEVKRMPEAVEVRPKIPVPKGDEIPFIPMGSLSENSMLIGDIETRPKASGARFQNGDTVFARITPCLENGKTGFVQFLPDDETVCCGSTEFIVLRSKTVCPEYVYLMARSDPFRDNAIKSMSGATGRQRVRDECFEQFLLAQPPSELLEQFSAITEPQFKLIHSLNRRNQTLRKTRDLLLPKLLSGNSAEL